MRPGSEIPPAAGTVAMVKECWRLCRVRCECVCGGNDGAAKARVYGNRFAAASLKFVVVVDAYATWRKWPAGFHVWLVPRSALPHDNQGSTSTPKQSLNNFHKSLQD